MADAQVDVKFGGDAGEAKKAIADVQQALRAGLGSMNDSLKTIAGGFSGLQGDLATLKSGLSGVQGDMEQTAARTTSLGSGFSSLGGIIKTAFAGIGFTMLAKETIDLADAYTRAESRLKLFTSSAEEQSQVTAELYTISQATRSSYLSNLDLYAKLAQALKGANAPQRELIGLTETLNKAFAISGASTEARTATTIQLSQALASGALRGDEFNSVMENGGRLVQVLTDYTGNNVGQLRKMAEQGQITADIIRSALAASVDKLDREYAKLPVTVADATSQLGNSLGSLVSDVDKASQASRGLSAAISGMAKTIDDNRSSILSFFGDLGRSGRETFGGFEMMSEAASLSVEKLGRRVTSSVPAIKGKIKELEEEIVKVNESMALRTSRGADTNASAETLRQLNHQLEQQKEILKGLTSSPYVTGEAAGKLDIVAGAWQRIGFDMKGVRVATDEEKKASEKAHESSLLYAETREQSLKREFTAAYNAARGDQERAAATKKYHEELKNLEEQQAREGKKGQKTGGGDTRLQEWKSDLDRMREAEGSFFKDSKQMEESFWQSKLADVRGNSAKEQQIRRQVEHELYQIHKQQAMQARQLDEEDITAKKNAASNEVEIKRQALQTELDLGKINNQQKLLGDQQLAGEQLRIDRAALDEKLQLYRDDAVAVAKLNEQKAELMRKYQLTLHKTNADILKDQKQSIDQMLSPITNAISTSVQGIIQGTTTMKKAMANLFQSIVASFVDMVSKMVVKWVAGEIMKTAITKQQSGLRTVLEKVGLIETAAATTATNVTTTASTTAANTAQLASTAPVAAAKGAQAVAATPWVGPVLAAAAFASIMAMIMGSRGHAVGSWDVPADMFTKIHKGEMIVPEQFAQNVRDGGGLGGGGSVVHLHVNAVDAGSVRKLFRNNGAAMAEALRRQARNFTPLKV